MELFELGDDYLVKLNKTWIGTIVEFKVLLTRDKDRFKKKAQKEFTLIYHYIDFRSQFINYADGDRLKEAIRNAELPEDFKIEKDADLMAAINRYTELRQTRALKIIKGAFKAIDVVSEYFENIKITAPDEAKNIMASVGGLGKVLSSLEELEQQVKRQLSEDAGIRGDKEKGLREDPE